jgi:hypothetical protein
MSDSELTSDFLNLDNREFAISGEYINFSEDLRNWLLDEDKIQIPINNKVKMTSVDFLNACKRIQEERGSEYEVEGGERSFGKVAISFNATTGKDLSAAHIALILQILKDVRMFSKDNYHHDSVVDCISYASLKAELLFLQYNGEK